MAKEKEPPIEVWKTIPEFQNYQISNYGRVFNILRDHHMSTSQTQFGHVKVALMSEWDHRRYTRSVAYMVAEAFVEPPDERCDTVIIKDGNLSNVVAWNLAWRSAWFAWKYARQMKVEEFPPWYHNLPIVNVMNGRRYDSIIDAGITEGLLFHDIWISCHDGVAYHPNQLIFKINEKKLRRLEISKRV